MTCYSVKTKTRKYVEEYELLSFERNLSDKYGKNIRYCHKSRARSCKNGNQEIVHKTAEATGKLIENKIAEKFL